MAMMLNSGPKDNIITPSSLKQKLDLDGTIKIIDVREPYEFDEWHIKGSLNIPMMELGDNLRGIDKSKEIITICQHGARSLRAAQYLNSLGYKAKSMNGGMVAWNSVYDVAEIDDSFKILQFRRVGKGCLSYMIIDDKEAVVIDPTTDIQTYIDAATTKKVKIIGVFDTHVHADHVSGGRKLADMAKCVYHSPDTSNKIKHEIVKDNSEIKFGTKKLKVITTPGHTPESVVYRLDNYFFTGDSLFVDSVGRPDLGQDSKENSKILWETLQKLLTLENAIILPAHYSDKVEIKKNIAVSAKIDELKQIKPLKMKKDEFVKWVVENDAPKPGHFEIIKKINLGDLHTDNMHEIRELEAGPNRCAIN